MSHQRLVAVVDDDEAVLHSMRFLLQTAGYLVAAYSSAKEFLNDRLGEVACLIVDYHMPGMTGLELLRHLREASVPIPALLVTASPSATLLDQANEFGIKVLEKPIGPDDLIEFIEVDAINY